MDNVRRIGLRVIHGDGISDDGLNLYLEGLIKEYSEKTQEKVYELNETVKETEDSGQPYSFAMGKMLNYLATLEKPELIELLAGALWTLAD